MVMMTLMMLIYMCYVPSHAPVVSQWSVNPDIGHWSFKPFFYGRTDLMHMVY